MNKINPRTDAPAWLNLRRDAPLAFIITIVMQVVDLISETRTQVNEEA